jgi:hypothetical protein
MDAVAGAIAAMGSLQGLSQWATMGKPKAVGVDPWDREVQLQTYCLQLPGGPLDCPRTVINCLPALWTG